MMMIDITEEESDNSVDTNEKSHLTTSGYHQEFQGNCFESDDDDDDDGKDEIELSENSKTHDTHIERKRTIDDVDDDDDNDDNDDEGFSASLYLEKEDVLPMNGEEFTSEKLFIPRRTKLLAKFVSKSGKQGKRDTISSCKDKIRAIRRETNFGLGSDISHLFDCYFGSLTHDNGLDFNPKVIRGTSQMPSVVSTEPLLNRSVYDMKYSTSHTSKGYIFNHTYPNSAYYEVTILKDGDINLGFTFSDSFTATVQYLGATGELNNNSKIMPYGYPFRAGDIIGCGLFAPDPCNVYAFFVHNGRPLPHVLCNLMQCSEPIVKASLQSVGCRINFNFNALPTWKNPPLSDKLRIALDNPQYFPDVCFCFRDSPETILAHKAIIAARCPSLAKRCSFSETKDFRACSQVELIMLDEDFEQFRNLLEFMYSGSVIMREKFKIEELFCLASRVGYDSLVMRCRECLERGVFYSLSYSFFNIQDLLNIAFENDSRTSGHYYRMFFEKDIKLKDFIELGANAILANLDIPHAHVIKISQALDIIKKKVAKSGEKKIMEPPWALEKDILKLLKSPRFADVKISVGSKSIMAHKVILAAACEYLNGFLQKPFITDNQNSSSSAMQTYLMGYNVSQEYNFENYIFSTKHGSSKQNPDLYIGYKTVPLDEFIHLKEDNSVEKTVKNISAENIAVTSALKFNINASLAEELVEPKRMIMLGIFKKSEKSIHTIQQCFLCKSFAVLINNPWMGACGHFVCRSCFLNAIIAPLRDKEYKTINDYILANPNPQCPCHNCSKKISLLKAIQYFNVSIDDPIETLYALAGTEKLRNAEVRREGIPVSINLPDNCDFSIDVVKCYLSFLYSGYNKDTLKPKYISGLSNLIHVLPDNILVAVLWRMSALTSEVSTHNFNSSYWLTNKVFRSSKSPLIDVGVYLLNNFEEFVMKFSRHPNLDAGIINSADKYVLRVSKEKSKYPYAVLYAHYTSSKDLFNFDENAFRAAKVSPEDALIKYYIGKNLGFDDLKERARGVILNNRNVDPASPSFVKIFGFVGKKYKKEIIEEFIGIVKANMESDDNDNLCSICKKGGSGKVRCCVCNRLCCNNFKNKNNCSAMLPAVPPQMDWVEGPGIACTLCRKVAIICFLN